MFSKPLFISSTSATSAYTIDQSIRFNDDDSAILTASQTGAGDTRKKNTFSVWVKRCNLTSLMYIGAYRYDATNYQYYSFDSSDRVEFTDVSGGSVIGKLVTTQVFRDPSAWYNLTFVWDSANAVSTERMKIFVNGQRVTTLTTATYPSVNTDSGGAGRASSTMRIGTYDATGNYLDGYLTDIVYIDNGALDPSSFGETNDNGIWIPKDVSIIRMVPSSSEVFIWDAIASAEIDPSLAITTSDEFWVAQDMGTGKTYLGIYDASATAMKWIANDGGVDGNPSA